MLVKFGYITFLFTIHYFSEHSPVYILMKHPVPGGRSSATFE
jgi:hypothetical protein